MLRVFAIQVAYQGHDPVLVDNQHLVYPKNNYLDIKGHHVHVLSTDYQYPSMTIANGNCTLYAFGSEEGQVSECVLEPTKTYEYNIPKPGFSVLGFLKNPTMLLTFVSMGMMLFMPKIMEQVEMEQDGERPKDLRDAFLK